MIYHLRHSAQFFARSLDVLHDLKLILEFISLTLDVFKGHINDSHHHVNENHVHHN